MRTRHACHYEYAQAARLPLQDRRCHRVLVSMPIDSGKINFYAIWNFLLDLGVRNCSGSASTAEVLLNTKQPKEIIRIKGE